MSKRIYSTIIGTGKYIPTRTVKNEDLYNHSFYEADGSKIEKPSEEILTKFEEITTIKERKYVSDDLVTSDIAYLAGLEAIKDSGIAIEDLDYIILAHNFGDVKANNNRSDIVPSLASRVKYKLGIKNPKTIAYDVTFGCPGWVQIMIQADYFIRSGDAKNILIIGAEALSRVLDPYDRDGLLYADGAGAAILQGVESDEPVGILKHNTRSDTFVHSQMLHMGPTFHEDGDNKGNLYLKMNGRKLYQYALETVPQAIKECMDACGVGIHDVKKLIIHQANGKMDFAMLKRLFDLYHESKVPEDIMPMTVSWLGNSSVATLPTILDLILKNELPPHHIHKGDILVFASVGAGMNINAVVYKY